MVSALNLTNSKLLICGDFNLHLDNQQKPDAMAFIDALTALNLKQHVDQPTHQAGHTLDLIITRQGEDTVIGECKVDTLISDHFSVLCKLVGHKPPPQKKTLTYRKIKAIDLDKFKDDIVKSNFVK